ncbi:hypothetical protein [Sphingobacterium cavernae]|uniref:hypothetical protein n=1 Tax=Sphingobacterium cavernae TaxID=2592657 RepID=UPI00123020E4|nr:hypothetical protein [Sphingobacterium cavernae]
MIYATKAQIQKIHVLLNQLGLIEDKAAIIYNISEGRTESSRKLSCDEAKLLIRNLSEFDPSERMKSLIFSLAYQTGIIYGDTAEDKRINVAKLNMFLKERGTVKKEINGMTYEELLKTQRQFEGILRNQQRSKSNKEAGTAIKHLLEEINLQVK